VARGSGVKLTFGYEPVGVLYVLVELNELRELPFDDDDDDDDDDDGVYG
jgi:hypothetical protein